MVHHEQQREKTELATFREYAYNLIVAIADVGASTDLNTVCGIAHGRRRGGFFLFVFAAAGEGARMHVRGGPEWQTFAAGVARPA
ncbi:hypothetical protein ACPCSD_25920 [Streptomyces griseoincarnatus]|uniref:Uncharacterized protein n=1 Tax=Streptomyces tunisiensis TaxID=948699 RepID=A0ABP7Y2R6_9ACTN